MSPLLAFVILIISFYLLAKICDEIFITSLDNIAHYFKLPHSVSGATFMAAGTSAPELSTTLFALFLAGANPATGLGTVVGSAIFQILVVIGFAATIKTSYLNWKPVIRDGLVYVVSILLLIWMLTDGLITFFESSVLVSTYFAYLLILIVWSRLVDESAEPDPIELVEDEIHRVERKRKKTLLQKIIYKIDAPFRLIPDCEKDKRWTVPVFVFSLAAIAVASYFLVTAGEAFALGIGVPASIVALTILAGGTSVPELISSAIVARKGRGDMAISNAIGSNVLDILISLGLPLMIYTALNGTLDAGDSANITSSIFLLLATVVMVIGLLTAQKFKAGKKLGLFLITIYIAYVLAAYTGVL